MNITQDYFHLQSEWRLTKTAELSREYQHLYSREQVEEHLVVGVSIKELDLLASRETYSLPFCPKIYKCSILRNYCQGNNLLCDIALLVEKLQGRNHKQILSHNKKELIMKKLELQLDNLILAFQYLFKRYGPFLVLISMVSWSQYQVVKVWFNSNYLKNQIEQPAKDEEEMVSSLIGVIEEIFQFKFNDSGIKNFASLLENAQKAHYKKKAKQVKFNPVERSHSSFSNSHKESIVLDKRQSVLALGSNKQSLASIQNMHKSLRSMKTQAKQQKAYNFKFQKRMLRCKSSYRLKEDQEDKIVQRPSIRLFTEFQNNSIQSYQLIEDYRIKPEQKLNEKKMEEQLSGLMKQQDKQNSPQRRQPKHLTCLLPPQRLQEPRRYSNNTSSKKIIQQNASYPSKQNGKNRRRSSLLRMELEGFLDNLFHSNGQISFDEEELEKELFDVL